MAFNHRKLIINFVNQTISEVCEEFCDPTKNSDGPCPIPCLSICLPNCRLSFRPPPLPYIHIDSDDNPSKHHHVSSPSLFLTFSLASLAAALFLLLSCYAIYRWYNRRSRRTRISQQQPQEREEDQEEEGIHSDFADGDQEPPVVDHPIWYIRTVGFRSSVIRAITVVKYKRGGGLVDGTVCAVCLNEFQEDEALRLLPKCNHAFHLPCIDTWLTSHTNCPMCRAGILINTAARLPSLELGVENSGPLLRETQVEIVESNGDFNMQIEDEACGLRNWREGEEVAKTGESSNNKPMGRSVSADDVSASAISTVAASTSINQLEQVGGYSNSQLLKGKELNVGTDSKRVDVNQNVSRQVYCSVSGRSAQKGPFSVERSGSRSGKVLSSSRYSRSRTNWDSSSSNF